VQVEREIVPIEAKAATNLKAKSLKSYRDSFKPQISIRTATADYKEDDGLHDIPLYLLEIMQKIIS